MNKFNSKTRELVIAIIACIIAIILLFLFACDKDNTSSIPPQEYYVRYVVSAPLVGMEEGIIQYKTPYGVETHTIDNTIFGNGNTLPWHYDFKYEAGNFVSLKVRNMNGHNSLKFIDPNLTEVIFYAQILRNGNLFMTVECNLSSCDEIVLEGEI